MELWIRSQDKKYLSKINALYIGETNDKKISIIDNDYNIIAFYKSKERALEVLDEIENILKPQEYEIPTTRNTFISSTNISNYVYQMPKE